MDTYSQGTGWLRRGGSLIGIGYSGCGEGLNNTECQDEPNLGPCPQGVWILGEPFDSPKHGPYCIPLTPAEGTNTFGRSEFLVHGDSIEHAGEYLASRGCVILRRSVRHLLREGGDGQLTVIP